MRSRLLFAPGLALVLPFVAAVVPEAYAQISCGTIDLPPCPPPPSPPPPTPASAADVQAVAATSQGLIRNNSRAVVAIIDLHLLDVLRDLARGLQPSSSGGDRASGLAAGDVPVTYAVWGDAAGSYLSNDSAGNAYQGRAVTALAGIEATIGQSWVVGVSAGYSHSAFSVLELNGTRTAEAALAGPYAAYVIDEHFTVDASLTYWKLRNQTTANGGTSSGDFGSYRYVGAVNANAFADWGPVSLTGFGGYTYAWEHAAGYVDSANTAFPSAIIRYGALRLGGEASYPIGDAEPYLPLTYSFETTTPHDGTTRNSVIVGLGIRYRVGDQLKLGLVANAELFRQHQQDDSIEANLRFSF